MRIAKPLMLILLIYIAGCSDVSTDPSAAFSDIQKDIYGRTGHYISWNTQSKEDKAVEQKVQKMLKGSITADQAVQIALLNNPKIQAFYERLGVAQARLVQAGLLKNPVFDASLKFVEGSGNDYILGMGAAQDFLDILLIDLRVERQQANFDLVKAMVTSEVMNLASQAQMAFFSYQGAFQTYNTNLLISKAAGLYYEAAKRLKDAGNITELELIARRSIYEQSKIEVTSSHTKMLEQREELNKLMGLWGKNTNWETKEKLPDIPTDKMDVKNIEQAALKNSLDLIIAHRKMEAVAAQTDIDISTLVFPELATGIEAEREPDGTWSIGPTAAIGIPIFDTGQARKAAGAAKIKQLWNEYTALAIEIRATSRSARYRLQNARQQADYYKQVIVPLSEKIFLETQLQYNAMQLGVFDLLNAKRMEYDSQRSYIETIQNYWLARTELELLLDGHLIKNSGVSFSSGQQMSEGSGGH
ncbi:MAG: TolC family protein [Sedimentisphaeraceae bacterium JB056]